MTQESLAVLERARADVRNDFTNGALTILEELLIMIENLRGVLHHINGYTPGSHNLMCSVHETGYSRLCDCDVMYVHKVLERSNIHLKNLAGS